MSSKTSSAPQHSAKPALRQGRKHSKPASSSRMAQAMGWVRKARNLEARNTTANAENISELATTFLVLSTGTLVALMPVNKLDNWQITHLAGRSDKALFFFAGQGGQIAILKIHHGLQALAGLKILAKHFAGHCKALG